MKVKAWAVAGAVFALLSGCTTATPYQPLGQNRAASGGYFEEQIESNRFRVTFSGNSMTSRDTVERYLLYRAAELTRQRGYDWFVMADRNTERRSRTYVDRPFGPGAYGYWARPGVITTGALAGATGTPYGAILSGEAASMSAPSTAMRRWRRS